MLYQVHTSSMDSKTSLDPCHGSSKLDTAADTLKADLGLLPLPVRVHSGDDAWKFCRHLQIADRRWIRSDLHWKLMEDDDLMLRG